MKKLTTFLFFHFAFLFCLFGQDSTFQCFVHFDFDKYNLNKIEKTKLDSFFENIDFELLAKIEITGHTDNYGGINYNDVLSKKRMETVQQYLIEKEIGENKIYTNYFGEKNPIENNDEKIGRQKNRRVELVLFFKNIENKQEEELGENIEKENEGGSIIFNDTIRVDSFISENEKLFGDTTLIVDEVQVVISKKDFEKYKDCLEIKPIMSGEEAFENNLTTMTVDNQLLVSCGMIGVLAHPPCEGCFEKPLKIRFPAKKRDECDMCKNRTVYDVSSEGRWLETDDKIKKVKVGNKYYYEMLMHCPGKRNCDCPQSETKVKFKLPKKYTIEKLNVVYDCPVANYDFLPKKNKAKGKLTCDLVEREAYVYLTATHDLDTINMERIPLDKFEHSIWKRCKKEKDIKGWWFFKKWKYKVYSKYKMLGI